MSIVTIVELAALAVIIILVVRALDETKKARAAYEEQRNELTRAISIIKDFQMLHPGMISLLQRLDSVGIVGEAQKADLMEFCRRIDERDEQLVQNNARMSEFVEGFAKNILEVGRKQQGNSALMRKETLSQDPALRFNVLKDWLTTNSVAILRRASQGWTTVGDLINIIPSSLEPEAEILDGRVLMVGTRGHHEKHAIAIRGRDSSIGIPESLDMVATAIGKPNQRRLVK